MSTLRALVEAVREARMNADRKCRHDDPDECCDQCRAGALLSVPAVRHAQASVRLSEYLLTHPEAVEAVEAVLALGKARAEVHTMNARRAQMALNTLADRLAAKGGE